MKSKESKRSGLSHSQVSVSGKSGKYLTVILAAIVAVLVGRGFFSGNDHSSSSGSLNKESIQAADNAAIALNLDMTPGQYAASLPVLPVEKLPAAPPPPVSSLIPVVQPTSVLAQNQSGLEETRLKSPSLVYSASDASKGADGRYGSANSGGDANNTFLQQAANTAVIQVSAQKEVNSNYKILQGKLISAVLETAINSDLPGMVRAVVSKDVYSDTGSFVLLPRGTRLIGQYNSTTVVGQTRVMVVWIRAITPNHIDIALGSPNVDSLGQSGMGADVDSHFWQVFGTSALLSMLGVAASNTGNTSNLNGNVYQTAMAQGVLNSSNSVLQARINMQPTLHVPQGSAIQVFVARDLDFSGITHSS